jgi:hypothetical protein
MGTALLFGPVKVAALKVTEFGSSRHAVAGWAGSEPLCWGWVTRQ